MVRWLEGGRTREGEVEGRKERESETQQGGFDGERVVEVDFFTIALSVGSLQVKKPRDYYYRCCYKRNTGHRRRNARLTLRTSLHCKGSDIRIICASRNGYEVCFWQRGGNTRTRRDQALAEVIYFDQPTCRRCK